MIKSLRAFAAALVLFALSPLAYAQGLYYESKDIPDACIFLPAPPQPGSQRFIADELMYIWGKSQREGERGEMAVKHAVYEIDDMIALFSEPFGRVLSEKETPQTVKLIRKSITTIRKATSGPKTKYARTRPFVYYNEKTLIPLHEAFLSNTGSYPSGHTLRGWGMALVLAQLNPERQEEILTLGYEWGQSRVICGVHWQSDVDAARCLAAACFARLQACPEYLADMENARKELYGE